MKYILIIFILTFLNSISLAQDRQLSQGTLTTPCRSESGTGCGTINNFYTSYGVFCIDSHKFIFTRSKRGGVSMTQIYEESNGNNVPATC